MSFWSRQTQGAEKNYSAFELEATAILCAFEHFCFYLYGTTCTVFTDHCTCVSLPSSPHVNRRLKSIALKLQEWSISIIYRPGASNQNADGLSRQNWMSDDKEDDGEDRKFLSLLGPPPGWL